MANHIMYNCITVQYKLYYTFISFVNYFRFIYRCVFDFYLFDVIQILKSNLTYRRLEHSAKMNIPKPDCLSRKDPASYTEEDIRAIESYEKKIRAQEADRQEYKSMLEAEIERISGRVRRSNIYPNLKETLKIFIAKNFLSLQTLSIKIADDSVEQN